MSAFKCIIINIYRYSSNNKITQNRVLSFRLQIIHFLGEELGGD